MFKHLFFKINYFSRHGVIALIKIYQKTISFDHGVFSFLFPNGYCRFYPTCSNYGIEAVSEYGIIKGTIKTIWRILRCNPFNSGGYDPIKNLKK